MISDNHNDKYDRSGESDDNDEIVEGYECCYSSETSATENSSSPSTQNNPLLMNNHTVVKTQSEVMIQNNSMSLMPVNPKRKILDSYNKTIESEEMEKKNTKAIEQEARLDSSFQSHLNRLSEKYEMNKSFVLNEFFRQRFSILKSAENLSNSNIVAYRMNDNFLVLTPVLIDKLTQAYSNFNQEIDQYENDARLLLAHKIKEFDGHDATVKDVTLCLEQYIFLK
jgi:hypothetical protein